MITIVLTCCMLMSVVGVGVGAGVVSAEVGMRSRVIRRGRRRIIMKEELLS